MAETWFRKVIQVGKATGNTLITAGALHNLAALLQYQPGRLSEARQFADEALAIKQTLDAGTVNIWATHGLLAEIADQQSRPGEAAEYRRLAREAKRQFPGTAQELRRFAPVIVAVVQAVHDDTKANSTTDEHIRQANQAGGEAAEFARVIQRILAGERDRDPLCQGLSYQFSPVVETILEALADPSTLDSLLSAPETAE